MTGASRPAPDHGDLLEHLAQRERGGFNLELLGLQFTRTGLAHLADVIEHGEDGMFEEQVAWWNTLQVSHDGGEVTVSSRYGQASGETAAVLTPLRELTFSPPRTTVPVPSSLVVLTPETAALNLKDRTLLAAFARSDANVQFIRHGLLLGAKYQDCYWQIQSLTRLPRGPGTAAALLATDQGASTPAG